MVTLDSYIVVFNGRTARRVPCTTEWLYKFVRSNTATWRDHPNGACHNPLIYTLHQLDVFRGD